MKRELDELKKEKESSQEGTPQADTASLMKELVEGLREKSDDEKFRGRDSYVGYQDIDPKDVLKDPVSFYAHKIGYVIVDDKRNGHNVSTPFKRDIVFKYQSTKKVGSGTEAMLHNISQYTCRSKKELEWLEAHTFYGSIFFSSHKEAMSVDARRAGKLARIMGVLNRMEVAKVINMADKNGISMSEDIGMLRIAIANKQANEELAREDQANALRVKEADIAKQLIKGET